MNPIPNGMPFPRPLPPQPPNTPNPEPEEKINPSEKGYLPGCMGN